MLRRERNSPAWEATSESSAAQLERTMSVRVISKSDQIFACRAISIFLPVRILHDRYR